MHVIGLICEYNPFHNGHLYHINKIKELYPDSILILVLNGYFLQRGEVSILTKEDKTKIALENNIDIVLELPFIYGTQAADIFAQTSLKILNNFHVDKIVFGSETNDIETIKKIAEVQLKDSTYNNKVKAYLKEGLNYPTALAKALNIKGFEFQPNDLLGISYTKAILKEKYKIEPITIQRTNNYKDTISNDRIISASNIREKLNNNLDISLYLPKSPLNKLIQINNSYLFSLLKYKIITDHNLRDYLDVDEGIEYRLKEKIINSSTLEEFIENIKTKRYTYNKINRMLIHILIGLKKEDASTSLDYIRILGFSASGRNYLNTIKDKLTIRTTINKESKIFMYEQKAALIYDLINNTNTTKFETKKQPTIQD